MSKRPQMHEDIRAEDAINLLYSAGIELFGGKLSIQKANVIHKTMHDLHNHASSAYRAQLNSYKNPALGFYRKKTKPRTVCEEVKKDEPKSRRGRRVA